MVILPRVSYEWTYLRIQDFKSIVKYNSALFRITSQMKLCGDTITEEDMLEKTFNTFHASNLLLQQQYGARGFTEYNQLIYVLLVANVASLEVNVTSSGGDNHKRGRGHKQGRWNRKGKNHDDQFYNQVPR
ncbi:hypothetical protein EV1_022250 [Malus domestica]